MDKIIDTLQKFKEFQVRICDETSLYYDTVENNFIKLDIENGTLHLDNAKYFSIEQIEGVFEVDLQILK